MNINYKRNGILFLLPSSRVSFVRDEEIQLGSLLVIIPIFQSCISTELCSLILMGEMLVIFNWKKKMRMWGDHKLMDSFITVKQHEYKTV